MIVLIECVKLLSVLSLKRTNTEDGWCIQNMYKRSVPVFVALTFVSIYSVILFQYDWKKLLEDSVFIFKNIF